MEGGRFRTRLGAFIKAPVIVMSFRKTNGVWGKVSGTDSYELHYQADIELPQGFLRQQPGFWGQFEGAGDGLMIAEELRNMMSYKVKSGSSKWTDPPL